jgi:uncharacterized ParB-like nuclease family protein
MKISKIKVEITEEEYRELSSSKCEFCETEPLQVYLGLKFNGYYFFNHIRRLDSNKNLTKENSCVLCKKCNYKENIKILKERREL